MASEKGHLDALTDLGFIFENGIEDPEMMENNNEKCWIVEPELSHALDCYLKAKKENYPRALNNLGNFYLKH